MAKVSKLKDDIDQLRKNCNELVEHIKTLEQIENFNYAFILPVMNEPFNPQNQNEETKLQIFACSARELFFYLKDFNYKDIIFNDIKKDIMRLCNSIYGDIVKLHINFVPVSKDRLIVHEKLLQAAHDKGMGDKLVSDINVIKYMVLPTVIILTIIYSLFLLFKPSSYIEYIPDIFSFLIQIAISLTLSTIIKPCKQWYLFITYKVILRIHYYVDNFLNKYRK